MIPFEFICSLILFSGQIEKKIHKKKEEEKKIITNNINKKYDKERFCVCV
jgi:hypothetical protein